MRRSIALGLAFIVLIASCSSGDQEPAAEAPATTTAPTTLDTTTTTTTTAAATTTTTTSAAPQPETTTTTTEAAGCPDLFADEGPDTEAQDVVLAAWREPTGELLWEIPLGTRLPAWGVSGDQVILGFLDGTFVGLDAATCAASWSLSLDPISDLAVTDAGTTIVASGTELAGYSGPGFASWRQSLTVPQTFLTEGGNVSVFVDPNGTLTGIDTNGGSILFEWASGGDFPLVAIDIAYVYRALDGLVEARPVGGGDVVWTVQIDGANQLLAANGTVLVKTQDRLHAVEPQTGEIRWSIDFDDRIADPVVLDHGELHLASWPDTLWHLDPATGDVVFRGVAPEGHEWIPALDDGLVLEVGDDGTVTGISLLQNETWTLETGADRLSRVTLVERAPGAVVVTLTFSGERF